MIAPSGSRLKVVAFTTGPLRPVHRLLFERFAADAVLDVRAIVVERQRGARMTAGPRRSAVDYGRRLGFRVTSGLRGMLRRIGLMLCDALHRRVSVEESYERLALATGVDVHYVSDITTEPFLTLLRSFDPDVAVIIGSLHVPDAVAAVATYGALTLHKRLLLEPTDAGDASVTPGGTAGPTIRLQIRRRGPAPRVSTIVRDVAIRVDECDTPASVQIKSDLVAGNLYYETVTAVAIGHCQGRHPDASDGAVEWPHDAWPLHRLPTREGRKTASRMPAMRFRPSWVVKIRLLLQYALVRPLLRHLGRRFAVDGRVPICILFYHVVANRPVNHMTVLLEDFVDQIEFLRRYVEIVSLDEAVRRLRSGRNDRLAVAITFDDGYQDNAWAIEYLRYHRLPAAFFVSIGHVCDGTPFEHDRLAGFAGAAPMQKDQLQRLTASNLLVGSHGCHHEDFGRLDLATADRVLRDSREVITEITGSPPEHFAFPIGQRAVNITRETFQIAQKHYNYLYSAYGGYNFPRSGRTHFLRAPHPMSLVELAMLLDGYTGFRNVLSGNGWGRRTDSLPPY